ncbi:MAG: hypothetical protein GWN01_07455 [Nitrosopumilaceae archaeon]|nr:hypothetical protein [Nitrosopumilaceae archaeon]NIU87205.1 hypothetical protein [Nitrosopumilaceae archaeon]NIX61363.1 hypothetical protein [Nitrosopumilaceae archaeon]
MIDATLKKAAEDYEKHFPGKKVTFDVKPDTAKDNVEYIHANVNTPVRRAMYRVNCLVSVTEKDNE